jgi:hypothetical protein
MRSEDIRWIRIGLIVVAVAVLILGFVTRPSDIPPGSAAFPVPTFAPLGHEVPGVTYAIDAIASGPVSVPPAVPLHVRKDATVRFTGWALDPQTRGIGTAMQASIDGGKPVDLEATRVSRPDVQAALGNVVPLGCGFDASLELKGLAAGSHRVTLAVIFAEHHRYPLPTPITLIAER